MTTVAAIADLLNNPAAGSLVYKRDFYKSCQAFIHQMTLHLGKNGKAYGSAEEARKASIIKSQDMDSAPGGAIAYFKLGVYGHDAISDGMGGWVMGSSHIKDTEEMAPGSSVGILSSAEYCRRSGAVPYGWSLTNGVNSIVITPPPLQPYQRIVGPAGVNRRSAPTSQSTLMEHFKPGQILDFGGFVTNGEDPYGSGNTTWFKGRYSETWFHSGSFPDKGTHNLTDLTPVAPPVEPPYTFTKDLDCVTEVIPAPRSNWDQVKPFPTSPAKVVIHDFGTRGVNTLTSVLNYFVTPGVEVSAHFVVSGKRIIQMVSLHDRAWHAGADGNDFVGIESDPMQDPDTVASVQILLRQLTEHYEHWLVPILHSTVAATQCGDDIDIPKNYAESVVIPPPPIVPVPDEELRKVFTAYLDSVIAGAAKAKEDLNG